MLTRILVAIFALLAGAPALARGGRCGESALCQTSAVIVALVLLFFLVLSIGSSIAKNGLWRGLYQHWAIQMLAVYIGGLLAILLLFIALGAWGMLVAAGLLLTGIWIQAKREK